MSRAVAILMVRRSPRRNATLKVPASSPRRTRCTLRATLRARRELSAFGKTLASRPRSTSSRPHREKLGKRRLIKLETRTWNSDGLKRNRGPTKTASVSVGSAARAVSAEVSTGTNLISIEASSATWRTYSRTLGTASRMSLSTRRANLLKGTISRKVLTLRSKLFSELM